MIPHRRYLLVIMLLLFAGLFPRFYTPASIELKDNILNLKKEVHGWRYLGDISIEEDKHQALDPQSLIFRKYHNGKGHSLTLVVVYHKNDRWGAHNPIVCYKSQGWEVIEEDHIVQLVVNAQRFPVNRFIVKKNDMAELVYYYWFTSNRKITASRAKQMVYMVWNELVDGFSESGFVRISMPITSLTGEEMSAEINDFVDKFAQILETSL